MSKSIASDFPYPQQAKNLLIFLVAAGYIVTFFTASRNNVQYTAFQLIVGVLFGAAYLILALFDEELLRHFSANTRQVIFFTVECVLVLGVGIALGPGGNWLMSLPLVSIAVEGLTPRWRWLVYLGVLATVILPILYHSTWEAALMNTLFISPGILFVALITQVRQNEQRARENAERLRHDLEAANRQLAEYASQAEELAATQERNRLAREIHDNLGHYLTIVNVQIEAAKAVLNADPSRAMDALNKAQELARKGLTSVRESVTALRVSPVENRPLEDAIAELVEESQSSGIATEFNIMGDARPVQSKTALVLYRAAQEGLTNVSRHSKASCVTLLLDFSRPDSIRLTLRDNGVGAADTNSGFGLVGLRERVQLLGGEFKVHTQPGHGFEIEVALPYVEGDNS